MTQQAEVRTLRGSRTRAARPQPLDGGDEMFPLRNCKSTALMLGVSRDTVLRMWRDGSLPYVQIGGDEVDPDSPNAPRLWRTRDDQLKAKVQSWTR